MQMGKHINMVFALDMGRDIGKISRRRGGKSMKKANKQAYEKPAIKKEKQMNFPREILKSSYPKTTCRQCSSCHGCR